MRQTEGPACYAVTASDEVGNEKVGTLLTPAGHNWGKQPPIATKIQFSFWKITALCFSFERLENVTS